MFGMSVCPEFMGSNLPISDYGSKSSVITLLRSYLKSEKKFLKDIALLLTSFIIGIVACEFVASYKSLKSESRSKITKI